LAPSLVLGLPAEDPVVAISGGESHMVALTQSGTVYAWGYAHAFTMGQEQDENRLFPPSPVNGLPTDVVSLSAADQRTFALTASGDLYVWGWGWNGSLGAGSATSIVPPQKLDLPEAVAMVTTAYAASVIATASGTVYVTGTNSSGLLGRDDASEALTFTEVPGAPAPAAISAGSSIALIVTPTGLVYAWGQNSEFQAGVIPGNLVAAQRPAAFSVRPVVEPEPEPEPGPTDEATATEPPSENPTPAPSAPSPGPGTDSPVPGAMAPNAPAPDQSAPDGPAPDSPANTGLSRMTASFITVVVKSGRAVTVPLAAYHAPGTATGQAEVTWTASSPKVASVAKGKKTGRLSITAGTTHKLTIHAAKTGKSRIALTAPGAKKYIITVKVIPASKARQVSKVTITPKISSTAPASASPFVLRPGKTLQLKARVTPLHASRIQATWASSDPTVATVNAVGRVSAVAPGTTTVTCTVGGKTAHKTIRVTPGQV
jgi:hypothetical protein